MENINELKELIRLISKLPGLGKRSAQRLILKLINNRDELMKPLVNNLAQVYKNVSRCKKCGNLKSNTWSTLAPNLKLVFKELNSFIANGTPLTLVIYFSGTCKSSK